MRDLVIDLFAGPGGWDEGARDLALGQIIGIEHDLAACQTRAAAGHQTIRADVAAMAVDLMVGKVRGLIASPPCQAYSMAGKREGLKDVGRIVAHATGCRTGWTDYDRDGWHDARSPLVLEVLRWALTLQPDWIACEQVPAVLPLWETFAGVLGAHGWQCWAGVLNAADYGVPQTRKRAFLLASRTFMPTAPPATHAREPQLVLFGEPLRQWVSMADALGWDLPGAWTFGDRGQTHAAIRNVATQPASTITASADNGSYQFRPSDIKVGFPRRGDRGDSPDGYRTRDWRTADQLAQALTEKTRSWQVVTGGVTSKQYASRPVTEPATPITSADNVYYGPSEAFTERDVNQAIRLSVADALILQSFPPDYPIQGTRTKQFEQVGNAVPPLLARHVLTQFA